MIRSDIGLNFPGLCFEEPEAALPAPDSDAQAEAEPWAPAQEDFESLVSFRDEAIPLMQNMYEQLQSVGQAPPGQMEEPQAPGFDIFDESSVQSYIEHAIEQGVSSRLEERFGPMEPLLGHIAEVEGEKLARAELDSLQQELGEFDQDQAVLLASGLVSREEGFDPSQALRAAAEQVRQFEARIREDERSKHAQHLQTISTAPGIAPAGGAAGVEGEPPIPTGPGVAKYEAVIQRAIARRNGSVMPTG